MQRAVDLLVLAIVVLWCVVEGQTFFKDDIDDLEKRLEAAFERKLDYLRKEDAQRIQRLERLLTEHTQRAAQQEIQLRNTIDRLSATENQLIILTEMFVDSEGSTLETLMYKNLSSESHERRAAGKRLLDTLGSSTPSSPVAFSAMLSKTATELGMHHTIPFDTVIINEGNGFDPVLHVFTCPTTGVYVFMTALLADYHENTATDIVINGNRLSSVYSAGGTGGHGFDQGFNSAITHCNAGDRVWVQIHNHQGTTAFGGLYCSFSGYRI